MITAGQLNRRIQIQTQTTTQDEYGQPLPTWTTVYQCWAGIGVQNSQLVYSTAEFVEKVTYRIECRWTHSFIFTPGQRVVYVESSTGITHTYEIQAVLNDRQDNKKIILMVYELGGKQ